MRLAPGTRVGPYEIRLPLGAGGMGEVYRAHDARLNREVAIKALPAASLDAERAARFRREAQILAGLSHPHIAALYGLEEVETSQFLVMELVEGGTLSERLGRGPIPLREALTIARQVADALQAAHDRGIIHRDLKPANIALTVDGHAKVLDFGLAKAFSASSDAPTVGTHATESGVVLGTAAYMSPEQARGLPLDKRSDIFAFGGVLFEMLTARHPFAGDTVSDIIVAVLGREPDWTLLPANTPARVQWLLRRCLEKDPKRRLHDIADARIELDEALVNPGDSGGLAAATAPSPASRTATRELAAWLLAGVSLVGVAVLMVNRGRSATDAVRVYNTVIPLPELSAAAAPEQVTRFALSPDGTKVVFVGLSPSGTTMLWVRPLDSAVAQPIAGTEGGIFPFWSADSRQVGFIWKPSNEVAVLSGRLKRVAVTGGEAVSVSDVRLTSTSAWNGEGVMLFTPAGNAPVHLVKESGGTPAPATVLDAANGHVQHAQPSFLPDGRHFLYSALGNRTGATAPTGVYVVRLGEPASARLLVAGASQPSYANGYLLFVLGSSLMAQPFDPDRLELSGSPSPITQRLEISSSGGGIAGAYSASATGVLAFQTTIPVRSQLTWFDRSGKRLEALAEEADWVDVALSPDGSKVASSLADPATGSRDIWILDVRRRLSDRFTSTAADDFAPVWSPRGDRLIFSSTREGRVDLFQKSQSTEEEQRIADGGLPLGKFAASWSPDSAAILFIAGGRSIARSDLMVLPVAGGIPQTFADSNLVETQARFSPDGKWIAFAMNTGGRLEVYVKPYGRAGNAVRVSRSGGRWPRWHRDLRELVFLSPDEDLMSASIRLDADTPTVVDVRPLFKVRLRPQVRLDAYPYDMTPDGQRFLVNAFVEDPGSSSRMTLIINWPELLRK